MNISCHACIGGTVLRDDMRRIEAGCSIIVGTPGRSVAPLLRLVPVVSCGHCNITVLILHILIKKYETLPTSIDEQGPTPFFLSLKALNPLLCAQSVRYDQPTSAGP